MKLKLLSPIFLVKFIFCHEMAVAGTLHLAVASNFTKTAGLIQKNFERSTGHRLKVSSGSSGKIFSQIQNGAPFEVFLAADQIYTARLESSGYGLAGSRQVYALGKLVLLSHSLRAPDLAAIRSGEWKFLALANPGLAPYGKAAMEVLEGMKIPEHFKSKFVYGENVAQTLNFIKSGNADFGFVALAQVLSLPKAKRGGYWLVPQNLYSPIQQELITLKKGENNPVAPEFLKYMKSEVTCKIIEESGYELPSGQ